MPEDARYGSVPPGEAPGETPGEAPGDDAGLDLPGLARDWITLWQSELAAMAVDREAQETWHTMLGLWAGAAGAMLAAAPRERPDGRPYGRRHPAGHAGTAAAPGAPPAAALAGGAGADAAFPAEVLAETLRQDAALVAGIAAYRRHPFRRDLFDPPAVWAEGGSRLLDYGRAGDLPVLFVPSLVNRAYVLDLAPGHSLLRWLAGRGIRPLLLDWGWPEEAERRFTLTDYVAGRLERALTAGYCMGGTLAVAAAERRPDLARGLALLATPWNFHAGQAERAAQAAGVLPLLEPALAFGGTLPVDMIQVLFAMLDPFGVADKYRGFARIPPDSRRAELFVALEDWLNDGVPLAAPVARECLGDWYGRNAPAAGDWLIAGLPVDPTRLSLPSFVAAPARDRIVPPESSRPLAVLIPGAVLHEPRAGHIGMTAGSSAERVLWEPLLTWLESV
jgi:polyhydroxyalkanoate synthase